MRPQARTRSSAVRYSTLQRRSFTSVEEEHLTNALEAYRYTALVDFEWLVKIRLEEWLKNNSYSGVLAQCMDHYLKAVKDFHADTLESFSSVVLGWTRLL